jgi:hypothetical protein
MASACSAPTCRRSRRDFASASARFCGVAFSSLRFLLAYSLAAAGGREPQALRGREGPRAVHGGVGGAGRQQLRGAHQANDAVVGPAAGGRVIFKCRPPSEDRHALKDVYGRSCD